MFLKRLFLLALLLVISLSGICSKTPPKKVLISLDALPERFSQDKLPSTIPNAERDSSLVCYSLMGCYHKIPVFASPLDPMDMKTKFKIFSKDINISIEVEATENCLKKEPETCDRYPFDLQQIKSSPFRLDKRTVVIIGGYRSKASGNWETRLRELWSKLGDVNIIVVGWDYSNDGLYPSAAANTRPVSRQVTVLLYYLAKLKGGPELDLNDDAYIDKFYLIGHSLGAHISGFVGRDLAGRLGRITGLDPAGPSFDELDSEFRLDRSDARLVDVLHTNSGSKIFTFKSQLGTALASGHIDLWANNGQHQPGCVNEFLGCSHKRSIKFYESFLNDVLAMRDYLGDKYRPLYRLRAYKSDSFEAFHEGSSLTEKCPISTLDDNDLKYADLAQCSIPIDYLSWYSDYKKELEAEHGLNLEETVTTSLPNNFYFYSNADGDSQLDHYLIKVRVSKAVDSKESETKTAPNDEGCSISVDIEMANDLDNSYKIDNYHLINLKDHYEILFPFLAPNTIAKYEIAKLDSQDFLIERGKDDAKETVSPENMKLLRSSLYQVFPASVILRGFKDQIATEAAPATEDEPVRRRGLFDSIKQFFKGTTMNEPEEIKAVDVSRDVDCQLPIESFIVQPLRKFRRHLSAFYARECSKDGSPGVNIILLGENESSPKDWLAQEAASDNHCEELRPDEVLKLTLKTIIIGPLLIVEPEEVKQDSQLDVPGWEEVSHLAPEDSNAAVPVSGENIEKQLSEAKLWLTLTVLSLLVILVMILTSIPAMRRAKLDKLLSKQFTMSVNTNQATLAAR